MRCVSTRPGCRAKHSSRSYCVGVSTTGSPRTRTSRDAESISIGPRVSRVASTRAPDASRSAWRSPTRTRASSSGRAKGFTT